MWPRVMRYQAPARVDQLDVGRVRPLASAAPTFNLRLTEFDFNCTKVRNRNSLRK